MADLSKIKRNVAKMVDMGAPEADIDAYIDSEGVTVDELRAAPKVEPQRSNIPLPAEARPSRGSFLDAVVGQGILGKWGDEARGAVRGGARYLFGNEDRTYGDLYKEELAGSRANFASYQQRHPGLAIAGEIGGALATPLGPLGAAARGAGMAARIGKGALGGAVYGGVSGVGAGETPGERVQGGVLGTGIGAVAGAAAPVVVRGVQAAGRGVRDAGRAYIAGPARGLWNTEKEAARRIGIARAADNRIVQPRLSPAEEQAAIARGQPILNVDRGGEKTRALARSAANTSPEGRAALETALGERGAAARDRTADVVQHIVGGANAAKNREMLQLSARAANQKAYGVAFSDPRAARIWDEGLEQLATAPVVQNAIKLATITGKNTAALRGAPAMGKPFVADPVTGALSLRTDKAGKRMLPSLEFWDQVKQNLDKAGTGEARQFARALREHLDTLVPSYKQARSGAAKFFGAEDALEAGELALTQRMQNDTIRQGVTKMNVAERKLFGEGMADALVRKIRESGNFRQYLDSPAAKERLELAVGKPKAREIEAFLRVEDLMKKAQQAVTGNSTTARQLTELGIAGGGVGYGAVTGDWQNAGLILGGLAARRGLNRIDQGVAQRVGEMLASPDPKLVQAGIRMMVKNDRIMNALSRADAPLARGAAAAAGETTQPHRLTVRVPGLPLK